MLDVEDLSRDFGGFRAVDGVSFRVEAGSITGLIGPNGAGKSTVFNLVAGALRPTEGRIRLDGRLLSGLPPHAVLARGLARTFQIPRPFLGLTVLENVMLAGRHQAGERFWRNWLSPGRVEREERELRDRARALLAFVDLERLSGQPARVLSGGQRKLLELARVLVAEPRLLLLDEPAAGVNPTLLRVIVDRIETLNGRGTTFLIVEHNLDVVMRLCRPVLVMASGRLLTHGDPESVRRDPRVVDAYLGAPEEASP